MIEVLTGLHGFTMFCLVISVYYVFKAVFYYLPRQIFRTIRVNKNGWPPAHLDADGDFQEQDDDDTNHSNKGD